MENKVKLFLKRLKEMPDFNRVKFVFLFGSYSQGKQNKMSDIDFAVYYEGEKDKRFKFRLKLSTKLPDEYDIQIFQDLPIFVRKEILKGKLIYKTDIAFASDKAYETIKEFDSFKKYYYDYINMRRLR